MLTLDPYAARSCAIKTHHSFHPGMVRPQPRSAVTRSASHAEFVDGILDAILAGTATTIDLRPKPGEDAAQQQAACAAAMESGVDVIISGLLPSDPVHHRHGRADLLIRDRQGGYFPGLIKAQRVVDPRRDDLPFDYSDLADLTERKLSSGRRYRWHWRWKNALQLAHLWLMLVASGHAATTGGWGLVVGTASGAPGDQVAAWLELDAALVPPAPAQIEDAEHPALVDALTRYEYEFAERVRLAQEASRATPTDPALVQPIVSYECAECPWWELCRPMLDEDDLSLRINKSPLDRHEITALREAGVVTVTELAETDLDDLLADYLPKVVHRQGAEQRLRLAQRRSRLLLEGVELDRLTTGPIPIPQAELEIDIDVETSRSDRVYLWGFWVSHPDGGGHYQQFCSFSDLDNDSELALAREAMSWLRSMVAGTHAKVFHYSDYEVVRLNRLAASGDPTLAWAVDYSRTDFVDLFGLVRKNFFGTNGLGLKVVATAGADFHWRDDDPGGLNSMEWFEEAVHGGSEAQREEAQRRVLEYNEDDVRATWQLRRWLRTLD